MGKPKYITITEWYCPKCGWTTRDEDPPEECERSGGAKLPDSCDGIYKSRKVRIEV